MAFDLTTTDQKSLRSFWERKEGKWGMWTIALMVGGGVIGLNLFGGAILAAITTLTLILGGALSALALGAVLFVALWIAFATNVPKMLSYWFKAAVRRMAGVFVAVYPIEIIEEFVSKMKKKAMEFSKSKTKIKEQERIVRDTEKQVKAEKDEALRMMKAAEKAGNKMEMQLQAQIAGQADDTLKNFLQPSLGQMELLYQRLERVEKVIDFKIRGMENQAKNMKRQNAISKATKSALSAGWAILRGSDPDQELYDMATEYVVEDYRMTMGMVDDFMASTESILNGVDLKNGMWEEKALEMLAELDQKEQLLIAKTPEAEILIPNIRQTEAAPVNLPASGIANKYLN
jgi:hypothetical protein